MTQFGPDPYEFFELVYREAAPWDVGEAQPALLELFRALPPAGPVLDVGCGTGDLAIAIAELGLPVLGVDFIAAAIDIAVTRAINLTPEIRNRLEFRVADALKPADLGTEFGSIVDSGFLHLFDQPERNRFATELSRALRPGGRYYLLEFAVTFPGSGMPLEVTEDELRDRFSPGKGWQVLYCAPATFKSRVGDVPAIAACIERVNK